MSEYCARVLQVCLIPFGLVKNTSRYDSCSEDWCDHVPQIPIAQFLVGVRCFCVLHTVYMPLGSQLVTLVNRGLFWIL